MPRQISHNLILDYLKGLSDSHVTLDHFYRFNWHEIKESLKYDGGGYVFLMESHDGNFSKAQEGASTRNTRIISFLIVKHCELMDFDGQNQVYNDSEQIALDIIARINNDRKGVRKLDPLSWLRGFDPGTVRYFSTPEPLFKSYYGYNVVLELPNNAEIDYTDEVAAMFV